MLTTHNIIFWAGSLWDAEAYKLSNDLKIARYPFLGLLVCHRPNFARCFAKIEGVVDRTRVVDQVVRGVEGSGLLLNEVRQVRENRVQVGTVSIK